MIRNFMILVVAISIVLSAFAQPAGPTMKKPVPNKPLGAESMKAAPEQVKQAKKTTISVPSNMQQEVSKKLSALVREAYGYSEMRPPYEMGLVERWMEGTGYIKQADWQKDAYGRATGYVFQSSSSYAWGMASSRCWIKTSYYPSMQGWYEITANVYSDGYFQFACGYNGETYMYRNIGVMIDGQGYEAVALGESYMNQPSGVQTLPFKGWNRVTKRFYLYPGQKYMLGGYSEMGGWTSGGTDTWQIVAGTSFIGPFYIQYVGQ